MTAFRRVRLFACVAACALAPAAAAQEAVKAGIARGLGAVQTSRPTVIAGRPADLAAPIEVAGAASQRESVTVKIDHAKVVRLPERTQTVIVGNPVIADLTVQRNGIVVVTGKSYGITNLIALDGAGTMLAESLITEQAATEAVVVVQRGLERESYSCTPNCLPAILLGDGNKHFGETSGQAGQRNTLATQR